MISVLYTKTKMEEPNNINSEMFSMVDINNVGYEFVKEFLKFDVLIQIYIHRNNDPEYVSQRSAALKQLAEQLGVNEKDVFKLCEQLHNVIVYKLKHYVKQCTIQRWPMEYSLVMAPQWLREAEIKINILPDVIDKVNSINDPKGPRVWMFNKLLLKNAAKVINRHGIMQMESVIGDLDVRFKVRRNLLMRHWIKQCQKNTRALRAIANGKHDSVKNIINWTIADFLLLHKPGLRLVDENSLKSPEQMSALENLYEIVVKKDVEIFIRDNRLDELKKAWLEAYVEHQDDSKKYSLIFMQRRWLDLKRLTRLQLINNSAPNPLLQKIGARFTHLFTWGLLMWPKFVESGFVVKLLEDKNAQITEKKLNNEKSNITISQISKIDPAKAKVTLILDSDFDDNAPCTSHYGIKSSNEIAVGKVPKSNDTVSTIIRERQSKQKSAESNSSRSTIVQQRKDINKLKGPPKAVEPRDIVNSDNNINVNKSKIILPKRTETITDAINYNESAKKLQNLQNHVNVIDLDNFNDAIKSQSDKTKETATTESIISYIQPDINKQSILLKNDGEIVTKLTSVLKMVDTKNTEPTDKRIETEKINTNDTQKVEVIGSTSTKANIIEKADTNSCNEQIYTSMQGDLNIIPSLKEATKKRDMNTKNINNVVDLDETKDIVDSEIVNSDDINLKNIQKGIDKEHDSSIGQNSHNADVNDRKVDGVVTELIVPKTDNSLSDENNSNFNSNANNVPDEKLLMITTLPLVRCEHTAAWKTYCKNKTINFGNLSNTSTEPSKTIDKSKAALSSISKPKLNVKTNSFKDVSNRVRMTLNSLKIIMSKIKETLPKSKRQVDVTKRAKELVKLKGLPEEFVKNERNLKLLNLCRDVTVNVVRLPTNIESNAVRVAKRVNLTDIDVVRKINKTILTAQVAPVTLAKDGSIMSTMQSNETENSANRDSEPPNKAGKDDDDNESLSILQKKIIKAKSRSSHRKRKHEETVCTDVPVMHAYEEWLNQKNPSLLYFKLPNFKTTDNVCNPETEVANIDKKTTEKNDCLRSIGNVRKRKADMSKEEPVKGVPKLEIIDLTDSDDSVPSSVLNPAGPSLSSGPVTSQEVTPPTQAVFGSQSIKTGVVPGAGSWIIPGVAIIPGVQGQINMSTAASQATTGSQGVIVAPGIGNASPWIQNFVPGMGVVPSVQNTILGTQNAGSGTQNFAPWIKNPGIHNNFTGVQNTVPGLQNAMPLIQNTVPGLQNAMPLIQNAVPDIQNAAPLIQNTVPVIQNAVSAANTTVPNSAPCSLNNLNRPDQSSEMQNTQSRPAITNIGGQFPGIPHSFRFAVSGSHIVLIPQAVPASTQLVGSLPFTEGLVPQTLNPQGSTPAVIQMEPQPATQQSQMSLSDNDLLKHVATINTENGRYLYFLPPSEVSTHQNATPQKQTVPSTAQPNLSSKTNIFTSIWASEAFPPRIFSGEEDTNKILRIYDTQLKYVLDGENNPMVTPCDLLCKQKPTYWLLNRRTRVLFPAEIGAETYNPEIAHVEQLPTNSDPFSNWLRRIMRNSDVGQSKDNIRLYACSKPTNKRKEDQNTGDAPKIRVKSFAKEVNQEWPERVYIPHRLYQKIRDEPLTYVQVLTVVSDLENANQLLLAKLPVYYWRKSGELVPISGFIKNNERPLLKEDFFKNIEINDKGLKQHLTVTKNVVNNHNKLEGKTIECPNRSVISHKNLVANPNTTKNSTNEIDASKKFNKADVPNTSKVINLDDEENIDINHSIDTETISNVNSTVSVNMYEAMNIDFEENFETKSLI